MTCGVELLYRVTRQVSDLGWVDSDLACSSSCLGSRYLVIVSHQPKDL